MKNDHLPMPPRTWRRRVCVCVYVWNTICIPNGNEVKKKKPSPKIAKKDDVNEQKWIKYFESISIKCNQRKKKEIKLNKRRWINWWKRDNKHVIYWRDDIGYTHQHYLSNIDKTTISIIQTIHDYLYLCCDPNFIS